MKQVPLIRIVDDDPSVGASFRFVLEAVGYQVRTYESATEFLDGDDPTREGCMLLDVRMPGLSGPELQTRLAEMKCDLPIIFLTAHGEVRMAVEAVQAGQRRLQVDGAGDGKRHAQDDDRDQIRQDVLGQNTPQRGAKAAGSEVVLAVTEHEDHVADILLLRIWPKR